MIVIEHPVSRELAALADEIAATEGLPMGDAYALALGSLAGLLAEAQADTRYAPSRVVMFENLSQWPTVFCSGDCESAWTDQWGFFEWIYRGAIESIEAASDTCLWCNKSTRKLTARELMEWTERE